MLDSSSVQTDSWQSFNVAIRSYMNETKSLEHFDHREFEEIILSKNALRKAEKEQKMAKNKNVTQNAFHRPVTMVDLELALVHMFRREIPQQTVIRAEAYDALVQWLMILTKVSSRSHHVVGSTMHFSCSTFLDVLL